MENRCILKVVAGRDGDNVCLVSTSHVGLCLIVEGCGYSITDSRDIERLLQMLFERYPDTVQGLAMVITENTYNNDVFMYDVNDSVSFTQTV